jgi:YD repeat-containing protein
VSYGYDALDRIQSVSADGGLVAAYGYKGPDRISSIVRPGGVLTGYTYDSAGRLTGDTEAAGAPLVQYTFSWSLSGDLLSRSEAVGATTQAYTHDSLHRLKHSSTTTGGLPPADVGYQRSLAGDRVLLAGGLDAGEYTRDATLPEPADFQMHQYTAAPSGARSYDANGNTLTLRGGTGGALTLTYDADGQVVTSTGAGPGGGTTTSAYDAFGRLIDSALNLNDDGITYYGSRTLERYANGTLNAWFVYGAGGRPLAMHSSVDLDGDGLPDTYAYHTDEQGSVVAMTGPTGSVAESYRYDDSGNPSFFDTTGGPLSGSSIGNPFLFQGLVWSPRSNVYLDGGNQFDPHVARWVSPVGLEQCDGYGIGGENGDLDDSRVRAGRSLFMKIETGWSCQGAR